MGRTRKAQLQPNFEAREINGRTSDKPKDLRKLSPKSDVGKANNQSKLYLRILKGLRN